jgi:hypothetical protein
MKFSLPLSILSTLIVATSSHAAVVTTRMDIHFDGSLSGSTYTRSGSDALTTGTFSANGTPTVSGGFAKLDGSAQTDANADGFRYATALNLPNTSFFVEVSFRMDDLLLPGNTHDNIVSIGAANELRYNGGAFQFVYDAGGTGSINLSSVAPTVGQNREFGILWDATAKQFSVWENSALIGSYTAGTNFLQYGSANSIGFGFIDLNTFTGRGSNSTFNRVSFSTFTGSFNHNDFVFVPEPSTSMLCLSSLGFLFIRKRKSHPEA